MNNFKQSAKFKLFIFSFLYLLFFFFPKKIYASVIFEDNFETDSLTNYTILGSSGWSVQNGQVGIHLDPGLSNLIPNLPNDDSVWKNINFKVDLKGISGTDKNIAFRFQDQNNFYEIHHSSGKIYLEKVINGSVSRLGECNLEICNLFNGITYHFNIFLEGENIHVFLDDVQIFDVNDTYLPTANGKIALRVGTGAEHPSEVWYDNVLVEDLSPSLPPAPIVFLPGLGGSFNFKEMFLGIDNPGGWKITPGANVYKNLLETFKDQDYFYIFYYDWRLPVLENAQKLDQFIQDKISPTENNVRLIGHSLGGLVARTCIQKTANNCYAEKLITVGSPQSGAVDAFPALEGGEIWRTGPIKLGYELLVHFNQKLGETKRDTLERIAPVLHDLMPSFNYLSKFGLNLSPSSLHFVNLLLPQLQDYSLLDGKTTTITGEGFDSVEKIILGQRNKVDQLLGNWIDGKPINKINTQQGDTSVLLKSGSFNRPTIENFTFNLDHGGIISDQLSLTKILQILDLDLPVVSNQPSTESQNYLVFMVHSPVRLDLPNLPENAYQDDEIIIIPDPITGQYNLDLVGTGKGHYVLSVGQIFGDFVTWNDFEGEVNLGEIIGFPFIINPNQPTNFPLIDSKGEFTNQTINDLLAILKEQINGLNSKSFSLKTFLSYLAKINLKKPSEAIDQIYNIRMALAIFEKTQKANHSQTDEIRFTCQKITNHLEYLASLENKNISKIMAKGLLTQTLLNKTTTERRLTKKSVFLFVEAQEKDQLALDSFDNGNYFLSSVYSNQALSLLKEATLLSY